MIGLGFIFLFLFTFLLDSYVVNQRRTTTLLEGEREKAEEMEEKREEIGGDVDVERREGRRGEERGEREGRESLEEERHSVDKNEKNL